MLKTFAIKTTQFRHSAPKRPIFAVFRAKTVCFYVKNSGRKSVEAEIIHKKITTEKCSFAIQPLQILPRVDKSSPCRSLVISAKFHLKKPFFTIEKTHEKTSEDQALKWLGFRSFFYVILRGEAEVDRPRFYAVFCRAEISAWSS